MCIASHYIAIMIFTYQESENKLYVLASRTICLIDAIPPITTKIEDPPPINVFTQKIMLCFEGLKVILKNTIGNIKSRGMNANAPNNAIISGKNGNIAAKTVAAATDIDLESTLGTTFLMENCPLFGSPNIVSNNSFVGCRYTCNITMFIVIHHIIEMLSIANRCSSGWIYLSLYNDI